MKKIFQIQEKILNEYGEHFTPKQAFELAIQIERNQIMKDQLKQINVNLKHISLIMNKMS